MPESDRFLKTRKAAPYIGMSVDTLTKRLKEDPTFDLPYINCGSYRLFRQSELDAWLERNTVRKSAAEVV